MALRRERKITIVELQSPKPGNVEDEIKWLCRCLDLDPKRDKIAFQIFLHLLNASRNGKGLRSIEVTRHLNVTQAAVVYHINGFLRIGVVEKKGTEYYLRGGSLEHAVIEMEGDMIRRMRLLRQIAGRIDSELL